MSFQKDDNGVKESRSRNAKRNAVSGLLCKIVQLLLPFIIRRVIISNLGIEYLGINSFCVSVLQILNVVDLGFSDAIIYSLYKPLAEDDAPKVRAIMNYFRRVYMVMGTIIFAIGLCIMPFITHFIKSDLPSDVNIYIAVIIYLINSAISYFFGAYKSVLLYAGQRNDINMIITTVSKTVVELAQIVLIIHTKNYYTYLFLLPVATLAYNLIVSHVTDKRYPDYIGKGILDKSSRLEMRKNICAIAIDRVKSVSRNSFDSIVISSFMGLAIVGKYNNYYYILTGVMNLMYVLSTSVTAGIGDSIAGDSVDKNYGDFRNISFVYMWLTIVIAACLLCLYQPFMKIWMGEKYLFGMDTVLFFCIYFYVLQMCEVFMIYLKGAGLWKHSMYRGVVAALMNIILNVILGYYFGVNGIILATVVSVITVDFIYTAFMLFKHYFRMERFSRFILDNLLFIAVGVIDLTLTYYACIILGEGFLIRLPVCIILSCIIWGIAFCRTRIFNEAVTFVMQRIRRK